MRRVVQKSTVFDRDRAGNLARRRALSRGRDLDADEILPPFIVREENPAVAQSPAIRENLSRNNNSLSAIRENGALSRENNSSSAVRENNSSSAEKSSDESHFSRARIFFAKIFQSIAYLCLFVGLMAVLAVVVAAVLKFWPQNPATGGGASYDGGDYGGGGGWWWLSLSAMMPQFLFVFEIIVGVAAILVVVWGWAAAVRAARRWLLKFADEIMRPLRLVEPLSLLALWAIAICGAWWLAESNLFLPLVVIALGFLVVGLISFALMRRLAGSRIDLTRGDLAKK